MVEFVLLRRTELVFTEKVTTIPSKSYSIARLHNLKKFGEALGSFDQFSFEFSVHNIEK